MTEPTNAAPARPEAGNPCWAALERSLQNLADCYSDLIYYQDGVIHTAIILGKCFPNLNWDRLLDLYADSPDDWPYIIRNYLGKATEEELEGEPQGRLEEKPPPRCIGAAPDLFTGNLRPVYNPEPDPDEELPGPAPPETPSNPE